MAIKNLGLNRDPFVQKDTDTEEDRASRLLNKALAKGRCNAAKTDNANRAGASASDALEQKKSDAKADAKPEVKAGAEPEAKADLKPEVIADAKPEVKASAEPEVKADAKPEVKASAEPEVKADLKPEVIANAKPEVKASAEPEVKADAKPDVKAEVEADAKADVETDAKPEVKAEAEPGVKADAKAEVETDANPGVKAEAKPEVKADAEAKVKAGAEPGVKASAELEVKASAEPGVKAEAKAEVKAEVKRIDNILISKRNNMFLSPSTEYSVLNTSQLDVLCEICKLCVISGSLSTAKLSYEFVAEKASVNSTTIKGIIRNLEGRQILVKRDHQYVSGSKGRSFEVSTMAMLCMLTHNQSLRKWLARNSLRLDDIKKMYDFK